MPNPLFSRAVSARIRAKLDWHLAEYGRLPHPDCRCEEVCAEGFSPPAPACATCGDARFVRQVLRFQGDPVGGRAEPCPDCGGRDFSLQVSTVKRNAGLPDPAWLMEYNLAVHPNERVKGLVQAWTRELVNRGTRADSEAISASMAPPTGTGGEGPPAASQPRQSASTKRGAPYRWLVLTGPTGTGKTMAAVGALGALANEGMVVYFTRVTDLLTAMKDAIGAREETAPIRQRVMSSGLVVFDDLGSERWTEWVEQELYLVMGARYDASLPTVVTTNVSPGAEQTKGSKLWSRIYSHKALIVSTWGDTIDHRRGALT